MILFSASRPGGASCVFPLFCECRSNKQDTRLIVSEHALAMAIKQAIGVGCDTSAETLIDATVRATILDKICPELVVTALLGSWDEGLDLALLLQAKEAGIATLGILDSWMNIPSRFVHPRTSELFMPDLIVVPDEYARTDIIRLGIPQEKILVTGSPAFDVMVDRRTELRDSTRKMFDIQFDEECIVFFSEALRELNSPIGFDQYDALQCLVEGLNSCGRRFTVLVKNHPVMEKKTEVQKLHQVRVLPVAEEVPWNSLWSVADYIAGISSTLLVQAYIARIPTLLVHPGTKKGTDTCILSRGNYLVPMRNSMEVTEGINNRLLLTGKKPFPHVGTAIKSIMEIINNMDYKRRFV